MHGDHGDAERPTPDHADAPEPYAAPDLTDLGSFEELTQFQVDGPITDAEGFSA